MDEVLEAIRVGSGEIPKVKKKFVLKSTLEHAFNLHKAKAAAKHLTFSFDFDHTIPHYLVGDNIRIHRIVLELLANALNFTDSGFVKLSVSLANKNEREVIIQLMVEDSGIGFPKEKQQEIFLQFKRLTPSYKGIYKGAGLGLAVVKQFIDELNGEIYVESSPQKGAIFTCIIPLKVSLLQNTTGVSEDFNSEQTPPIKKEYQQNQHVDKQETLNKYRVPVVEDNVIAQTVARSILSQFECNVDIAVCGQEAISLWKNHSYDVLFMDIGLPDMDGYEVTHHIRVHEIPTNRHVPIIALTAHVGEENKQRCIESGMNAVLSKPLTAKGCKDILSSFIAIKDKKNIAAPSGYLSDLPESEQDLFLLDDFPLLNEEEGVKTTGSKEMLNEMLEFMIKESLPNDLLLLKQSHEAGDWKKTQDIAHKIKGGVIYVGAVRIKMACQYLERYWKVGKYEFLEKLYQQLLSVSEETINAIEKWLQSNRDKSI